MQQVTAPREQNASRHVLHVSNLFLTYIMGTQDERLCMIREQFARVGEYELGTGASLEMERV